MKLSVETKSFSQWSGDLLVLPFMDKKLFSHSFTDAINKKLDGLVIKLLRKEEFKGQLSETRLFATYGKVKFDYVLVVGLGASKELTIEKIRQATSRAAQAAEKLKCKTVVSLLPLACAKKMDPKELGQACGEGPSLGLHRFEKYKSKKNSDSSLRVLRYVLDGVKSGRSFASGLRLGATVSAGVLFARDLVNTPSLDKPPERLGREAKKLRGVRTRVFNHRQIKKMGMGALYGVGQGSANPPVLIEMHYKPKGRIKKRVALVGKGIVFDSGGLSLKPPHAMETMKEDMAGAAAVLGVMKILTQTQPPVEVYGVVAAAENMPDGAAQRPGDVVKAYNGKTIEVLNTDAEGRLALADALSYVTKHRKVDYIIDLATLTGAALVALGDLYTAALGTDAQLIDLLKQAGEHCGEEIWELPLEQEYAEEMKSPLADLKNIGGRWGGTINGGLFLQNFVHKNAKWVHLDIAGPSWANKPWAYCPKGGTGIMVRTLLRFLSQL